MRKSAAVLAGLLAVLSGLTLPALAEDLQPDDFAWGQRIRIDGTQPFYRLRLPDHVYTSIAYPDLRDLRIFNGHGEAVPIALVSDSSRPLPAPQRFPMQAFQLPVEASSASASAQVSVNDGQVQLNWSSTQITQVPQMLLVLPGPDPLPELDGLRLDWLPGYSNWQQRVTIEASNDLRLWSLLSREQPLLELDQNGQKLRVDTVSFIPTRARYWRITLRQYPAPVMRGATGLQQAEIGAGSVNWTLITRPSARPASNERIYRLPVPMRIEHVKIYLPQDDSVAACQLSWRGAGREEWQALPAAAVWRLTSGHWQNTSPPVDTGGHDVHELRLYCSTGWGKGDPRLHVGRRTQHVLFNARGSGPWTLAWGAQAASSHYVAPELLIPAFREQDMLDLAEALPERRHTLGGEGRLHQPGRAEIYSRWQTRLLWLALILGAAGLSWLAWRLWRDLPPEPR